MRTEATVKLSTTELLEALHDSPQGKALAEQHAKAVLTERRQLVGELEKLDRDWEARVASRSEQESQLQKLKEARELVRSLETKLYSASHARAAASVLFSASRAEIEQRLRASASPLIAAFIREMRDEWDRTRKMPISAPEMTAKRNEITDRVVRESGPTNEVAITVRMHAIRRAIEDAEQLYLVAEQDQVAARLDKLRSGLPDAGALSKSFKYGHGGLFVNDLRNGMSVADAMRAHCE